jgi:trk system potassium uptake protein TrkH
LARQTIVDTMRPVLRYLGALCWVFAGPALLPLAVPALFGRPFRFQVDALGFLLAAALAVCLGLLWQRRWEFPALDQRQAMLVCALGWLLISALGAIPLHVALGMPLLDALFESVSGFTTTGITMLTGLDSLPWGILFWRSLIQWLGGLGILTFFLAVMFRGTATHFLMGAESHKVAAERLSPGVAGTVKRLWLIYGVYTIATGLLLWLEGVSPFDALCHALTTLSTGGYSTHDASVGYWAQIGHPNAVLIEFTVAFFMIVGGTNFLVHYRLFHGRLRALGDQAEVRLWWGILVGSTMLVMLSHIRRSGVIDDLFENFRFAFFQVASLASSTGFATRDINDIWFPALAKQVFLFLMFVGGCVGSTGGGIKVFRVVLLFKMLRRELRGMLVPPRAVNPVVVDRAIISPRERSRVGAIFFGWIVLLLAGGMITAFFSELSPWASFSGMLSALGNMGPSYISITDMIALHPIVKLVYIFGMLAGRLEILPLLILFSRTAWR